MPQDIPLTHEQYCILMHKLLAMASGRKLNRFGRSQRMCRDDLVTEAREACEAINLAWSSKPHAPDHSANKEQGK